MSGHGQDGETPAAETRVRDDGRRDFLKLAGVVAAGASAAALLQACKGLVTDPTATPTGTSVSTGTPEPSPMFGAAPTPLPTPTPTAVSPPWTATPMPAATATPLLATATPLATALLAPAPTQAPRPSPTARPVPSPTPASIPSPRPAPTSTPAPSATPAPIVVNPERARLAYLLRRAGFGESKAELDRFEQMGLPATIDYLVDYEKADNSALVARLESYRLDLTKPPDLQRWWLARMIHTQRPLQEKMVLFWHGLLTSGLSRVGRAELMWRQNELFRQHALSSFPVLLKAVAQDPAMLIWLDSRSNRKSAPNENFARELMELFSMGVGNYTEQDVRESARAFTGWFLGAQGFFFIAREHDNGIKTFLGETGDFDGNSIIDIIVKQPATATYICRKLFAFFAYDNPEPAVLDKLRQTFTASGYSIRAVVRHILTSDAFYSARAYRSRPKSPAEQVVGAIRTLGIDHDANALFQNLTRMGQTLFDPPNVAGWPGGSSWFNSSTLLERVNFANRLASDRRQYNIQDVLSRAGAAGSPAQAVGYYIALLLDGTMAPESRAVLEEYARSISVGAGPAGASLDARLRSMLYLTLSSPDYQMA